MAVNNEQYDIWLCEEEEYVESRNGLPKHSATSPLFSWDKAQENTLACTQYMYRNTSLHTDEDNVKGRDKEPTFSLAATTSAKGCKEADENALFVKPPNLTMMSSR